MLLQELDTYLRGLLRIGDFDAVDSSLNGLQVGRRRQDIRRFACAVDASLATIEAALDDGADLLFVHHGLFWGKCYPLVGDAYARLARLVEGDLGLYACHLPLDADPVHGNNACIARALGLEDIEPFGLYRGRHIGVKGVFPETRSLESVHEFFPNALALFSFGETQLRSVAIISGGAPYEVSQAIAEDVDLYITGDASHNVYHQCREAGINMISAGHYATEVWGVRSVAETLEKEQGIETSFIDIPTGL